MTRVVGYPIRVAIIGMGGFAAAHHDAIMRLESSGRCKLVCTCDPSLDMHLDRMALLEFARRDVAVFDDYKDMLNTCSSRIDLITIPTPVPLHAEMHHACIDQGLAVYLEKPPTLVISELDAMLTVEASARFQTNVGFNFIIEDARRQLKQRLVDGEFGALRRVSFSGLWPRPRSYFTRAPWAGRLSLNQRLVLDSCFGNAMAHYVHNVLFWAGHDALDAFGNIDAVQAELYRAHDIEGTDTVFVKAQTCTDIELRLALSHACSGEHRHYEYLECENATITYKTFNDYVITWKDGRIEQRRIDPVSISDNLEHYLSYIAGENRVNRPATRLVDSIPFVELNDLMYIAAGSIKQVPREYLVISRTPDESSEIVSITGIDDVFEVFLRDGFFPSDQLTPWAQKGGSAKITDLVRLDESIRTIRYKTGVNK